MNFKLQQAAGSFIPCQGCGALGKGSPGNKTTGLGARNPQTYYDPL
ncbi:MULTISPECIES: hypothetical protein [unclassified Serratia (in: enterobacteria)]|nr:hypothetical protein [Serratia sp. C2(2)]MEE4449611.1 hypothetical protein [Serratia sp. C2(1)]